MTATPTLRVAIFASVSSPAQATVDKDSLPAQIRDGTAFAGDLGARVAATYQVPGHTRRYIFYTDAEADLDAYRQLRADCAAAAFDVLWCRARNRLGRTDALIAQVEALVAAAGAEVYSELVPHQVGHSSDASAIYLSSIERATAQVENVQRIRLRDVGIRARVRRGLPHGRWPYGYRPIRDEKGHAVAGEYNPDQIPAVELATQLYLAGHGIWHIAQRLNTSPYRPTGEGLWALSTIEMILNNDFYAGIVTYSDLTVPSDLFPALWDPLTHRALIRERARRHRGGKPAAYPLSGIVICARCLRRMTVFRSRHGNIYYRCRTHVRRALTGIPCHLNTIPAHRLLDAIEQLLLRLQDPAALADLLQEGPDRVHLQRQHARALADVAAIDEKRHRLALAYADGTMLPGIYRDADDRLLDDLATATARRDAHAARLATLPTPGDLRTAVADLLERVAAAPDWLRTAPTPEIRAALLRSGIRIYVEERQIIRITLSPD